MAIFTGKDADLSIAAYHSTPVRTMFGSGNDGDLELPQLSDARITRWALHTHRQMVDVTPKDSDVERWAPGPGGGMCLLRGWVDASPGAAFEPGRYDPPAASTGKGLLITLFLDLSTPELGVKYQFDGRLEMLNVVAPIDGPQSFSAIVRVDGEIAIHWR